MLRRTHLPALAALALLCACGTQSSAPLAPDAGAGWGQVEQPATAALTADAGPSRTMIAWPATPAFAAAYPGATVASSDTNGRGGVIAFRTQDSPGAVIAHYRAATRRAGLAQTELVVDARHAALSAGREGRSLAVDASAVGNFTAVSLVFRAR